MEFGQVPAVDIVVLVVDKQLFGFDLLLGINAIKELGGVLPDNQAKYILEAWTDVLPSLSMSQTLVWHDRSNKWTPSWKWANTLPVNWVIVCRITRCLAIPGMPMRIRSYNVTLGHWFGVRALVDFWHFNGKSTCEYEGSWWDASQMMVRNLAVAGERIWTDHQRETGGVLSELRR